MKLLVARHRMRSRLTLLHKVLMATLLVAAIPAWGLESIVFTPQWTAQAEFAGYYVAKEKGFYRDLQALKFAKASRQGWEWAAKLPDETIEIVSKYVKAHRIATNREIQ